MNQSKKELEVLLALLQRKRRAKFVTKFETSKKSCQEP